MRLLDVVTSPWAIIPAKLKEIRGIYATHLKGEKIDIKGIKAPEPRAEAPYAIDGGVAVIPVQDVLTKTQTFFSFLFGGTSMRDIADALQTALEDTDVHSIVLDIDSPGGTVDGTEELARKIFEARGEKPIIAVADGMIASAAYWIGSAADKIYIAGQTTEVGSIGVVATHIDVSGQDQMWGEKVTEITAGKYKRIASIHKPLSDEGRSYIQSQVDSIYAVFVESVAAYRGRSVEQILEAADGKIFMGQSSVDAGLVDGMATLAEVIQNLKEENIMDLAELKSKHPDIFQAVYEEGKSAGVVEGVEAGKKAGYDAGKAEGVTEGAKAEQERIKAVQSALIPGHEALIESMIADGKTTGAEAMAAVIAAEKKTREGELAKIKADAIPPAAATPAPSADDAGVPVDPNLPVEERAKAEWDRKPEIRAEFGQVENYVAYKKAIEAGRARILGRKDK